MERYRFGESCMLPSIGSSYRPGRTSWFEKRAGITSLHYAVHAAALVPSLRIRVDGAAATDN